VRFLVSKHKQPETVVRILKRLDPGIDVRSGDRYFLASWSPLVYQYAGFDRATASWASSFASFSGAIAGLALMRLVDTRGLTRW
jgi:AAHS family 4-hydroxybenzoate transporter-like MFS transporter